MLQQPFASLFTRMIPEAFLIIYSICILTNSKVNIKSVLLSGILGGIGVYILRALPVHFGVHTIISIMLYVLLAVKLNKIENHKAIATALVSVILIFISDLILVVIYTDIFHFSSEVLHGRSWLAIAAGIPSLILFYLIVKFIDHLIKKRVNYEQR